MGDFGQGPDIGNAPGRVGRRLSPDQLRSAGLECRCHVLRPAHIDEVDVEPAGPAEIHQPLLETPISLLWGDDVIARRQRLEGSGCRRHAAGEQHRGGAPLERGQQGLGLVEGRRPRANVGSPARQALIGFAFEGGRELDGRRQTARGGLDPAKRLGG